MMLWARYINQLNLKGALTHNRDLWQQLIVCTPCKGVSKMHFQSRSHFNLYRKLTNDAAILCGSRTTSTAFWGSWKLTKNSEKMKYMKLNCFLLVFPIIVMMISKGKLWFLKTIKQDYLKKVLPYMLLYF